MPGAWRALVTGTQPVRNKEDADGATDQSPLTSVPIETPLDQFEGGSAMVLPWFDATEDPTAGTGMYASMEPTYPHEDVGGHSIAGAYEAAVRTLGPVYQWGHEASGGLSGDQAIGRIMRFPANVPDRFDPYNEYVWQGDYRDELAAAIESNGMGIVTENQYVASLLSYEEH